MTTLYWASGPRLRAMVRATAWMAGAVLAMWTPAHGQTPGEVQTQTQAQTQPQAEPPTQTQTAQTQTAQLEALMRSATELRLKGRYRLALRKLDAARQLAQTDRQGAWVALEIGGLHLAARQLDGAQEWLGKGFDLARDDPPTRAQALMALGGLFAVRGDAARAKRHYQEALKFNDPVIRVAVGINLLLLEQRQGVAEQLPVLTQAAAQVTDKRQRAALHIRLANLGLGVEYANLRRVVVDNATTALSLARELAAPRLQAEALNVLAQMYEESGRLADSQRINRSAIALTDPSADQDLLIKLNWRSGRLARADNRLQDAIDGYQAATALIGDIRLDIPVTYDDGRSSFREALEPIYLGLTDLLLRQAEQLGDTPQATRNLQSARNAAEGLKQSELQDYLGDLCTVANAQRSTRTGLPGGTAVLYPILFEDRVETLVETAGGVRRVHSPISGYALRRMAQVFAGALRRGAAADAQGELRSQAAELYRVLWQPLDGMLREQGVRQVVLVPDGVLRMVPYGALFDGQQYVLERFALSVSPSLDLTQSGGAGREGLHALVAGLADPGPVANILQRKLSTDAAPGQGGANTRSIGLPDKADSASQPNGSSSSGSNNSSSSNTAPLSVGQGKDGKDPLACPPGNDADTNADASANAGATAAADATAAAGAADATRAAAAQASSAADTETAVLRLRESLRLPGVVNEVRDIAARAQGAQVLLNEEFTLARFSQMAGSGQFNAIHIASHGIFGGAGSSSYLLAHDKPITMDDLQSIIRTRRVGAKPIDLLTLSACETAEGDDRAPLGLAGAALKAKAASVVGTLWPVSDEAAQQLMVDFYAQLAQGASKTDALRHAQLQLMGQARFSSPFFWAPFTLVGAWQ